MAGKKSGLSCMKGTKPAMAKGGKSGMSKSR